jgi:hypothetical protein
MKSRFWSAFALLLAFAIQGVRAESFPEGDVFRPLVADPIEPRFFVGLVSMDVGGENITMAPVGAGVNFGLYRWPGERPGEGWQLGIFGQMNSLFNLDSSSDDLVNTDYRIGFPLSYKRGEFSGRARLFHQSSHLGDEFILEGPATPRVNLSVEVFDLVLAWERAGWRPYAGFGYVLRRDPDDLKQWGFQLGVDYVGTRPILFGGRLVGGVDYRSLEQTDWRGGLSAKVGLEYGRAVPNRRGVTVLLEYFDGSAPFGQFYQDTVTYYGASLQFDF